MSDNIKTLGGMPVGGTFLMEVGSKTVRATPFGAKETIGEPVTVMDMETVEFFREGGVALAELSKDVPAEEGDIVKLTVDGESWEERLKVDTQDAEALRYMGNLHMLFVDAVDTEEGYLLVLAANGTGSIILDDAAGVKSVSLEYRKVGAEAVAMDPMFGGGGASVSWNDLEDKPFGESVEKKVIYHDAALSHDVLPDEIYMDLTNANFISTKPMFVAFDGEKYAFESGATEYVEWEDPEGLMTSYGFYIGNPALSGKSSISSNDNGLPFFISVVNEVGDVYVKFADGGTHDVEIYTEEVAVTPLDAKYIPKAAAVSNAAGDTATGAEFNALLASLRAAGYLAT